MAEEEARIAEANAFMDEKVARLWPVESVRRIAEHLTRASGRTVTTRQVYAIAKRLDRRNRNGPNG